MGVASKLELPSVVVTSGAANKNSRKIALKISNKLTKTNTN